MRATRAGGRSVSAGRSEEHTSELQSRQYLVCRLLLEKMKTVARRTLDFLVMLWAERVMGGDARARNRLGRSPTYADVPQAVYKRAVFFLNHRQTPQISPFPPQNAFRI